MGDRRWLLVTGIALFLIALLAVLVLAAGDGIGRHVGAAPRSTGALAAILVPARDSSELVVVDLTRGTVVRRVRLRSLATDISLDASSGLVVAAQSGGIGREADDAASITDVRTGDVRYVTLPVPDPGDVACAGGRAFVLHSVVEASGSVVTIVDVARGRVTGGGFVPECLGTWSAAAGNVWTTTGAEGRSPMLTRIGEEPLRPIVVLDDGGPVLAVAESAGRIVLAGSARADGSAAAGTVRLFDPGSASVVASSSLTRLAGTPRQAVAVGGRLVVGDWSGDPPEHGALEVLDSSTLQTRGEVRIDGVPCALAAWDGRLLAVDRIAGRLLVVDPVGGRTLATIDLGAKDMVFSDVVVLEDEDAS